MVAGRVQRGPVSVCGGFCRSGEPTQVRGSLPSLHFCAPRRGYATCKYESQNKTRDFVRQGAVSRAADAETGMYRPSQSDGTGDEGALCRCNSYDGDNPRWSAVSDLLRCFGAPARK